MVAEQTKEAPPHTILSKFKTQMARTETAISRENERLKAVLAQTYTRDKLVEPTLAESWDRRAAQARNVDLAVDGRKTLARTIAASETSMRGEYAANRLPMYEAGSSTAAAALSSAGLEVEHIIPKTLGMVQCAACGLQSWPAPPGVTFRPCRDCGVPWYCDETCMAVHAPTHLPVCKGAATAGSHYWVEDVALALARSMLQARPKPSADEIMDAMDRLVADEKMAAKLAKKVTELAEMEPDLLEAMVSDEGQRAICQEQVEKARAAPEEKAHTMWLERAQTKALQELEAVISDKFDHVTEQYQESTFRELRDRVSQRQAAAGKLPPQIGSEQRTKKMVARHKR